MKGKLELSSMEFRAFHGCLEAEKLYGNRFLVDFCGVYDISAAAESDALDDAQDLAAIYDIISREMSVPSELIEHAAARIYRALKEAFPAFESISVTLSKCNPPLGGKAARSSITINGE